MNADRQILQRLPKLQKLFQPLFKFGKVSGNAANVVVLRSDAVQREIDD